MKYFLSAVFLFFAGLMVFVYLGARQANPVMLDEKGKPIVASDHAGH